MPDPLPLDAVKGVAVSILIPLILIALYLIARLAKQAADGRSEYAQNRERIPGLRASMRGQLPTFHNGVRDERVMAGLAVDIPTNTWVEQGKLSDEAIRNVAG